MADKIYCGSGKEKFKGDMISISVCLDDYPKEHISEFNGKRYLKLDVCRKREVDKYGKTHYVAVNTWKPDNQQAAQGYQQPHQQNAADFEDDIPF